MSRGEAESPAALLERAAAVSEERAAAADPGPWISFGDGWALVSAPVHDDRRTWRTVAGELGENWRANMAWMNSMSPEVAVPLVRLLRRMASVFGTHRTWRDVDPDCPEVALARAILGQGASDES